MNGYKTEEEYIRHLERRKRNRELKAWVSGTIMDNLFTDNLVRTGVTKFQNANPNPRCSYKKKRKRQH